MDINVHVTAEEPCVVIVPTDDTGIQTPQQRGRPMIIVRDIIQHAAQRKFEWIMAGLVIHLGYTIVLPDCMFCRSSAFNILQTYMSELNWGILFLVFGVARLCVLILNGTHIKQSSEVRLGLSAASFLMLCIWIWSIDGSATNATIIGVSYKWLALGELMNVWQSSSDMMHRRAKINARSNISNS